MLRLTPTAVLCYFMIVLSGSSLAIGEESKGSAATPATEEQLLFVRQKVVPLLEARCGECHKAGQNAKGGLTLSSRKAMLRGGESGAAIVPGKPNESLLIEAVRYESFEMPPRTRMPAAEVDILAKWIADGAHWPADLDVTPEVSETVFPLEERKKAHWAWQPITQPDVPTVLEKDWPADPVDAFVLQKLEAAGLHPAGPADRRTLIRRMYFDVIGLPPSVSQIEAFVTDPADHGVAVAKVVDELLASPHFGERWARHWLDLVRYADTLGHEFDYPLHNAWRYRDYVIRAINQDVPYNDFIQEHIAGDQLPNPRRHVTEAYNESVIGTGFWFLCEDKHAPVDVRAEEAAKFDNQIDVFSKTFLGMTVACARCHDHKFDAISTKDYYALAGFLQSSRRQTAWLDPNEKIAACFPQLSDYQTKTTKLLNSGPVTETEVTGLRNDITAALKVAHLADPSESPDDVIAAVATEQNRDQQTLTSWFRALTNDNSRQTSHFLSLLNAVAAHRSNDTVETVVDTWKKAMSSSANTSDSETVLFEKLGSGIPKNWFATGHAFLSGKKQSEESNPSVFSTGNGIRVNASGGVNSGALSHKLRGTLTSPTFELQHPEILLKVAGENCRVRLVIDGYVMNEFSELLFKGAKHKIDTKGETKWIRLAQDVHRYQGHRVHLEFLDDGDGWFHVEEIRFAKSAGAKAPADTQHSVNRWILAEIPSAKIETTGDVIELWLHAAAAHQKDVRADLFNLGLSPSVFPELTTLNKEWHRQSKQTPASVPVLAITEGTPENEYVFIRGSHQNPGAEAPRSILTALQLEPQQPITKSSGRMQLAERLTADDNPLTARVAVNRIWHHLFGAGIVSSTDNFGVLGQPPSHPELLDHLATRFRGNGWSLKKMIRTLILTRAYQMSSERSDSGDTKDPTNTLLHRCRIRRLQGEAIRDAILTVSGRLDPELHGAPVPVQLTSFMQGRGRPKKSGPLDGDGRRSIYISVNRNFLSPFMQAFDVPAPVSTTGKRTVSNVPAQALIMLNNEFVNQQAKVWAKKLLTAFEGDMAAILDQAWYELYSRPATDEERRMIAAYVATDGANASSENREDVLVELCHVLLNSKEFLFLH